LGELDEELSSNDVVVFDCGCFDGGSVRWRVAVAECGQGNIPIASIAHIAINHFAPDVLMLVGVAGGLKDVELGDVVAGSKIYSYHSGKDTTAFEPRPNVELAHPSLEQRARAVCR